MISLRVLVTLALTFVVINAKHLSFPAKQTRKGFSPRDILARAERSFTDNAAYHPSGPLWYISMDFGKPYLMLAG